VSAIPAHYLSAGERYKFIGVVPQERLVVIGVVAGSDDLFHLLDIQVNLDGLSSSIHFHRRTPFWYLAFA
jgi:hypothetical protein